MLKNNGATKELKAMRPLLEAKKVVMRWFFVKYDEALIWVALRIAIT
jgi:hypothetical protein